MPAPRGYTLAEFMVASVIIAMVLITLMGVYVNGYAIMRRGAIQTWAQHKANTALALVAEKTRPAYTFNVYTAYSASPGATVVSGNFLKVVNMYSTTAAFYKSGTTLYFVESEATDNKASSADDLPLVTDLKAGNTFIGLDNQVQVFFRVCDPRETNRVLVTIDAFVTSRNR
ncbi:MAG: prepilin-type N-terminal cleavage/methylation domain-containing protein [bacterium]|nr:prepilin-type N-terminal cleavage/methylation domain-containing protein [bacterium]